MAEDHQNTNSSPAEEKLTFNLSGIEEIFKSAAEASAILGDSVEKQMTSMEPLLTAITEQANAFAAITEAISIPALTLPSGLLDTIQSATKEFDRLSIKKEQPTIFYHAERIEPMPHQYADQQMAKLIAKEILAEIESRNTIEAALASTKKPTVPLPPDAQWKKLTIKFKDKFSMGIYYGGKFIGNYTHEDLGFAKKNTGDKDPDLQWELLHQLAIANKDLEIEAPTLKMLVRELHIPKDTLAQRKRGLSKQLCAVFNISDDPFKKHGKVDGYRTKFELEPEAILRDDGEIFQVERPAIDNNLADPNDKDEWNNSIEKDLDERLFS